MKSFGPFQVTVLQFACLVCQVAGEVAVDFLWPIHVSKVPLSKSSVESLEPKEFGENLLRNLLQNLLQNLLRTMSTRHYPSSLSLTNNLPMSSTRRTTQEST
ncbi:unnamed protein product [Durusdinium trenchii]|uniref:Secreted protein n=1 Tax=Durusdinium trenchii TaxID=1381693 RepID=A0ABP0S4H9_9DINO